MKLCFKGFLEDYKVHINRKIFRHLLRWYQKLSSVQIVESSLKLEPDIAQSVEEKLTFNKFKIC